MLPRCVCLPHFQLNNELYSNGQGDSRCVQSLFKDIVPLDRKRMDSELLEGDWCTQLFLHASPNNQDALATCNLVKADLAIRFSFDASTATILAVCDHDNSPIEREDGVVFQRRQFVARKLNGSVFCMLHEAQRLGLQRTMGIEHSAYRRGTCRGDPYRISKEVAEIDVGFPAITSVPLFIKSRKDDTMW